MAAKGGKKKGKRGKFLGLKKLFAAVSLIAFLVTTIAGLRADVRFTTIALRAVAVMILVYLVSWVVVKVLGSYEEIHDSGKT